MSDQWSFACPDWQARLRDGRPLVPDLPLNLAMADRSVNLFDQLRLSDVAGKPLLGDVGADWYRDILRAVFGSLDDRGRRRAPGTFVLVPKKNSKTTYAAATMIVALLLNRRPNALFGLFGLRQEIAQTAFRAAAGMIEADPDLSRIFHVRDHLKTIEMRAGATAGTLLKVTTLDDKVAAGGKYAGWLLDEAHLLGSYSRASYVMTELRGAAVSFPEQFGITISTQSSEPPAGYFRQELHYARRIRDGLEPDAQMLPVLYEFPEAVQRDGDAWRNPELWPQVQPNLGRSVSIDVLKGLYSAARAKGPAEERDWAAKHLNIEIGVALNGDRWVGADLWEAAGGGPATLEELMARSEVCTVGIDGGGLDDLLGLAVIGRCRETQEWLHWARAWAYPDVLERRKEIASRLLDFEAGGELTVCRDVDQDVQEAADIVERLRDAGLLPDAEAVGVDPAGISALLGELTARGIADEQVIGIAQGWRLNPAILDLERRLKHLTIRHGSQPLMAWCVANAKAEHRGNAVTITKATAGSAKIDPLAATFDAVMLMARNPAAGAALSPWEDPAFRISA